MSRILILAKLLERYTVVDGSHQTAIPELMLFRASAPTLPLEVLYKPSLCLCVQGAKTMTLGGEKYRYDPEHYLLVTADIPMTARVVAATAKAPYLALRLLLDPLEVGELVAQLGPQEQLPPACALAVSALDAQLLDSVIRLIELLGHPGDARVLAPLAHREITYRLLLGSQSEQLRQLVSGDGQGQRITRALNWLKAHFVDPIKIETLAQQAAMSPSALHRHFKAVTAMSPLQYQKRLRLHEARRLMLGEAADAAEASYRVGYESPSQFNREYRRLFGAPPHRDIQALRHGRERVDEIKVEAPVQKTSRGHVARARGRPVRIAS